MLASLLLPTALAGVEAHSLEQTFLSDAGSWSGGVVADGVLRVEGETATLDLAGATTLSGRLLLRQRDAAALRLGPGEATWTADHAEGGALSLVGADGAEQLLHFPHGHRSWVTEAGPALQPDPASSWEAGSTLHCEVVYDEAGATWFLYYTGEMGSGYPYRQIGVATSTDGENWTRYSGNPVITIDYNLETIDGIHAHQPTVTVDGDGTWHMFYACYQNNVGNRICHATSTDGLSWTRPGYEGGRMALDLGARGDFDEGSLREPDVSIDASGAWWMLYTGTQPDEHYGPVGLATSADGWTWTRVARLTEAESELQGGTVLRTAYGLEQWYQCNDAFCFAEVKAVDGSVDWTAWTMHPDPVLTKGWATWNSGYIQAPSAWLVDERTIHLWFNAYDYGAAKEVLGHARSVPLPDVWTTVDLAWDGATLAVSFDGGPALETALAALDSLSFSSDGTAELDELALTWTTEAAPVDTGPTEDTGPVEDSAGGEDTGPSTPAVEEAARCGCRSGGPGAALLLPLLFARRFRPRELGSRPAPGHPDARS